MVAGESGYSHPDFGLDVRMPLLGSTQAANIPDQVRADIFIAHNAADAIIEVELTDYRLPAPP